MTLITIVNIPTGIVMSGDSRTSSNSYIVSDATNKVFLLFDRVGIATSGQAYIDDMPIEHYIKTFELMSTHIAESYQTDGFMKGVADALCLYISTLNIQGHLIFMVAGYEDAEQHLYAIDNQEGEFTVKRLNTTQETEELMYTATWLGDIEITNRLTTGTYQTQFRVMNIQDAIDYSRHLIRTTIEQLRFEPRFPTVGGEIDTLLIQPVGGGFIYKKGLTYRP
ncbi:hypothetical protein [Paenibacillus kandeliae]|uniref:hypothetical protein n=1 Tax=Paenibacillus kandeliae TaxID=3231269 RepID=UPI00345795A6